MIRLDNPDLNSIPIKAFECTTTPVAHYDIVSGVIYLFISGFGQDVNPLEREGCLRERGQKWCMAVINSCRKVLGSNPSSPTTSPKGKDFASGGRKIMSKIAGQKL